MKAGWVNQHHIVYAACTGGGLGLDADFTPPNCWPQAPSVGRERGLKWSGCSVRIWLWLRLPHSCHRHLSNLPMFGGASARGLFSSSFLVPVSARCIRFLGSTGLCVHPGQWSLPSRGAAVAGPIRPH